MRYNFRQAILYYAVLYKGDWEKIAKAIDRKEEYQILETNHSFVTIGEPSYPKCFLDLECPPWILFFEGKLEWLNEPKVAIIGARNCSQAGINNTKRIVQKLKNRYVIVSGLAKGIDAAAHWSSLDQKTIGIIGCGLDIIYPKENHSLYEWMKRKHLVISEYPPGVPPYARNFPWRNRLIAAACESVIVVEAGMKSGTMLTVNECLSLGREVYCLPQPFNELKFVGCNYLISSGANILYDEQGLSVFDLSSKKNKKYRIKQLTDKEERGNINER